MKQRINQITFYPDIKAACKMQAVFQYEKIENSFKI